MYCFALQCFSVRRGDVEKKAFKWTGPPVGGSHKVQPRSRTDMTFILCVRL